MTEWADLLLVIVPTLVFAFGLFGNAMRRCTPAEGFFHTQAGHLVITCIGAILGALSTQIAKTGLSRETIVIGVITGMSAFIGALKAPGLPTALALLVLCMAPQGCATMTPQSKKIASEIGQDVEQAAIQAIPFVVSALAHDQPDWVTLTQLEAKYGVDIIKRIVQILSRPQLGDYIDIRVVANADTYLITQKQLEAR